LNCFLLLLQIAISIRGQPAKLAIISKLRIACMDCILAAMGWQAFRDASTLEVIQRTSEGDTPVPIPVLRNRIMKVCIMQLGSSHNGVVEMATQCLQLAQRHNLLAKNVLQEGLRRVIFKDLSVQIEACIGAKWITALWVTDCLLLQLQANFDGLGVLQSHHPSFAAPPSSLAGFACKPFQCHPRREADGTLEEVDGVRQVYSPAEPPVRFMGAWYGMRGGFCNARDLSQAPIGCKKVLGVVW
jgi:hypothetical protein